VNPEPWGEDIEIHMREVGRCTKLGGGYNRKKPSAVVGKKVSFKRRGEEARWGQEFNPKKGKGAIRGKERGGLCVINREGYLFERGKTQEGRRYKKRRRKEKCNTHGQHSLGSLESTFQKSKGKPPQKTPWTYIYLGDMSDPANKSKGVSWGKASTKGIARTGSYHLRY